MRKRPAAWKRRVTQIGLLLAVAWLAAWIGLLFQGYTLRALWEDAQVRAEVNQIGRSSLTLLRQSSSNAGQRVAGGALAHSIRLSRSRALGHETRAVPPDIRCLLQPSFPLLDFEDVRWKPASGGLSLGTVLTKWYMNEGAVVLKDVVVFTSVATTRDRRLWAHELTHVVQYKELGVDEFAMAYVMNSQRIEDQAERNALRIMKGLDLDLIARCSKSAP